MMVRWLLFKLGSALRCVGCHLHRARQCMNIKVATDESMRGVWCPSILKFDALCQQSLVLQVFAEAHSHLKFKPQ